MVREQRPKMLSFLNQGTNFPQNGAYLNSHHEVLSCLTKPRKVHELMHILLKYLKMYSLLILTSY